MKGQKRVQVHIAQAIAVGRKERVADRIRAAPDSLARVARFARIDDLYVPIQEPALEVIPKDFLAMSGGEHKIAESLRCIKSHQMHQDGSAANRHHYLGKVFREGIRSGSFSAAQNYDFYRLHCCCPRFVKNSRCMLAEGETLSNLRQRLVDYSDQLVIYVSSNDCVGTLKRVVNEVVNKAVELAP